MQRATPPWARPSEHGSTAADCCVAVEGHLAYTSEIGVIQNTVAFPYRSGLFGHLVTSGYSQEELATLRGEIATLHRLTPESAGQMAAAVSSSGCPPHLAPFLRLKNREEALFEKLTSDNLLAEYSIYILFPLIYERVYGDGRLPTLSLNGRSRGCVALFRLENGDGLVVKPRQSRREDRIAQAAAEAAVGPKQHPSLDGFLTEELVGGPLFTELRRWVECCIGYTDRIFATTTPPCPIQPAVPIFSCPSFLAMGRRASGAA